MNNESIITMENVTTCNVIKIIIMLAQKTVQCTYNILYIIKYCFFKCSHFIPSRIFSCFKNNCDQICI